MNFTELSIEDKKTFVIAVEAGLYPYGIKGGGFTFMIDDKGLWWGTNKPSKLVKEQVDALVAEFKAELQ